MAPARKHDTDEILDAALELVLSEGPRAASVAAIAARSGAPVGTLYHRFGNRDGLLAAVWIRALGRFQALALAAAKPHADPVDRGVALATATVAFLERHRRDAQLLLAVRRGDLMDAAPDRTLQDRIAAMNEPLIAELREIARALRGRADKRAVAAVTRAVVDLPYSTVRRYASEPTLPRWLADDVAADARLLLKRDAANGHGNVRAVTRRRRAGDGRI
jgi:AcrR family transcriptional regulator